MSAETDQVRLRSVGSLQQIYAVVIALAISQAIQALLKNPISGALLEPWQVGPGVPSFVAFLVTLIPFWHGMNRHLDRCYVEKKDSVAEGALLFDFGTFFLEGSLLFAVAWSLRSWVYSFIGLGALLVVDMCWGFVSHQIHFHGHKSHVIRWSTVNLVAIFVAVLVVALPFEHKALVLMVVAIVRSICDYGVCWRFYFPPR